MEHKQAYVQLDDKGNPWVACPYCNKRVFPISKSTKIENLSYRCKGSSCKQVFLINIGNYHQKRKEHDGQLSMFDNREP
jgi:DNA-directed RNA polymerase subunit RPC12/RpoP